MDEQLAKKLAAPFPAEKVKQKKGQGGRTMSFVSHGLVTERLNDADPEWSWMPLNTYTYVGPDGRLHCEGVEVALTVGGVTRVEAGGPQRQDGFANEIKNAYSDALKRAAMRFGVALHMWESLVDSEGDEDYDDGNAASKPAPPRRQEQAAPTQLAPNQVRIPCADCRHAGTCRTEGYCQAAAVAQWQPRPTPTAPPPPAAGGPHPLLDTIRDDTADPKKRRSALHNYFMSAGNQQDLSLSYEAVKGSGLPDSDLSAAYEWHYQRITTGKAPAPKAAALLPHAGAAG